MEHKFGQPVDDARYSNAVNFPVTTKKLKVLTCPANFAPQRAANNGITYHNYVVNFGNTIYDQTTFSGCWQRRDSFCQMASFQFLARLVLRASFLQYSACCF
jgi:hypothetical protein